LPAQAGKRGTTLCCKTNYTRGDKAKTNYYLPKRYFTNFVETKAVTMETIIRIKKNKPAFKALILLAKELAKNDHASISINEVSKKKQSFDLIAPTGDSKDPFSFFDQLSDFPNLDELRKKERSC